MKRESIRIDFTADEIVRIDEARGTASRTAWLRQIALAALRAAEIAARVPSPRPADGTRRCNHPGTRIIGGYCKQCDHVIEPGGLWR